MDTLIEFCLTGTLGPLAIGMNALETDRYLGRPDYVREIQGEPNWQRHRYGSLLLRLMAPPADRLDLRDLRVRSIMVQLSRPLSLPDAVAGGLTRDWTSTRTDDLLRALQAAQITARPDLDSTFEGVHFEHYRVHGTQGAVVDITSRDGVVQSIEALESQKDPAVGATGPRVASTSAALGLRHGRAYSTDAGRLAVTFVSNPGRDGQPLRVELTIVPDGGAEQDVTLRVGDRFRLGPEEWTLISVDNVGTYDYVVNLDRVADR
jgi:hypothetical protein